MAPLEARLAAMAAPMPGGVSDGLGGGRRRGGKVPLEAPVMRATLPSRGRDMVAVMCCCGGGGVYEFRGNEGEGWERWHSRMVGVVYLSTFGRRES